MACGGVARGYRSYSSHGGALGLVLALQPYATRSKNSELTGLRMISSSVISSARTPGPVEVRGRHGPTRPAGRRPRRTGRSPSAAGSGRITSAWPGSPPSRPAPGRDDQPEVPPAPVEAVPLTQRRVDRHASSLAAADDEQGQRDWPAGAEEQK